MLEEIINIQFGGKIPTKLFKFRCNIEDYEDKWEKEYISELIGTLKKGMVVYDIGAESGEPTVLAAKIVGGENVHIFEPNIKYFPNIKGIWEANELPEPANCFNGYVSDITSDGIEFVKFQSIAGNIFYGCEHVNPSASPMQTICLDDYCKEFMPPNVIMMDIEGAELSVVRGAISVIQKYSPIFFISIHKPFFLSDRSNGTKEDLIKIFIDNGYDAIHLSTDHEEHWKFIKN